MSHTPVTHSDPISMPRHPYLLVRKGRFYFNMRVPKDLRPVYPDREFFRKTLRTTNPKEAKELVNFEACRHFAEFDEKRKKLKSETPPPPVRAVSDKDAHDLVFRWFVDLEKKSEAWWESEEAKFRQSNTHEILDNLRIDEMVFRGGNEAYRGEDGSRDVDLFLKAEGLQIPKDSPGYSKLVSLFTKARLENISRSMARVCRETVLPRDPLFRDAFAHTELHPISQRVTVKKMVERYHDYLVAAKRSKKTLRTYQIPCRLLLEEFGSSTPVASISKEQMEELFKLLRNAPTNATKRYPGLTLKQAVEMADKKGDKQRLSGKSLDNYRVNILAIFDFAEEEKFIERNPAKGRTLTALMQGGRPPKPKVHFTVDEMNRLFRVSPFELDGIKAGGRNTPAKKIMRRGRAWATLLSLFHGCRCNEVTQLYTDDVKIEGGILYLEIREEREDGSESDKKIKTKQSKRRMPIHSEILKMGFRAFVDERKNDSSNQRLFPDLPRGADGYYSGPFSQWFSGFVDKVIGEQCEATFSSFRHQFRDALREAGVSTEDAERLGGWKEGNHSAERGYGRGPSLKYLRKQIQKVKFPRLDLSHLYVRTA